MGHDDVKFTELVVNDSIVAGSNLTKNVTREVSPIAADQEAMGETTSWRYCVTEVSRHSS